MSEWHDRRFMLLCGSCRWWQTWGGAIRDEVSVLTDRPNGQLNEGQRGECRRHAPILLPIVTTSKQYEPEGRWPFTEARHGCGDYQRRLEPVSGE